MTTTSTHHVFELRKIIILPHFTKATERNYATMKLSFFIVNKITVTSQYRHLVILCCNGTYNVFHIFCVIWCSIQHNIHLQKTKCTLVKYRGHIRMHSVKNKWKATCKNKKKYNRKHNKLWYIQGNSVSILIPKYNNPSVGYLLTANYSKTSTRKEVQKDQ
jgi:hypothetical protein